MPSRTSQRPHAITCIKESVQQLLKQESGDDLTISCDRDDCWSDSELFKFRQAVNIVTRNDVIGTPVKNPRDARKLNDPRDKGDANCFHNAFLNVEVQIYAALCNDEESCSDPKSKAYEILSHIISTLTTCQDQIVGRRVLYQGSDFGRDSDGDFDLAVVTATFQIHYLFDQTRPWVVG